MRELLYRPTSIRLAIVLAVASLLGFGYFLQYIEGLEPCPLCITQRFFLLCCGLVALAALLHRPGSRLGTQIYAYLGTFVALVGSGFSMRQLYLQNLPEDQVPACGPGIGFIFETFPLMEALSILLRGDGNCAEVVWTFLGLSIPAWTLLAFIGLAIAAFMQILAYDRQKARPAG